MDMRFIDIDAQQPDSLTAYIVYNILYMQNVQIYIWVCVCVSKYNYKNIIEAGIDFDTVNQNCLFHEILQNSVIVMKIRIVTPFPSFLSISYKVLQKF